MRCFIPPVFNIRLLRCLIHTLAFWGQDYYPYLEDLETKGKGWVIYPRSQEGSVSELGLQFRKPRIPRPVLRLHLFQTDLAYLNKSCLPHSCPQSPLLGIWTLSANVKEVYPLENIPDIGLHCSLTGSFSSKIGFVLEYFKSFSFSMKRY